MSGSIAGMRVEIRDLGTAIRSEVIVIYSSLRDRIEVLERDFVIILDRINDLREELASSRRTYSEAPISEPPSNFEEFRFRVVAVETFASNIAKRVTSLEINRDKV